MEPSKWYVAYVRTRFENKVYERLRAKGIISYLPKKIELRQWHDRKKKIETPVFPSYLFISLNGAEDLIKLYNVPGFIRLITTDGEPDTLSAEQVELIKKLARRDFAVSHKSFIIGEAVTVTSGLLKGVKGVLVGDRGDGKLAVKISSVNSYIIASVSVGYLRNIGSESRATLKERLV
ncbi:UpxY family transcription antiterminator [Fulvivirga sp. 29W222]|uniref:UpxY family transcription antiterminator n=1 Tax=Fulvivirga marina TaxID=2494733 RepID=A0A937KGM0_9BACT|nr:UpxY family transcription antiterminator [Fulvivirga marina]MBL6449328.1 UpxY family transcription antiterminator [Fulvivirga marina]